MSPALFSVETACGSILVTNYSRTSLIRTPKGQSKVSVLERCPYKRGHYDNVTFMTLTAVLSVQ